MRTKGYLMKVTRLLFILLLFSITYPQRLDPTSLYIPAKFNVLHRTTDHSPPRLSKGALATEPLWVQTYEEHYSFSGSTQNWIFSSRDTSIYNSEGNRISYRCSKSKNSWDQYYLMRFDSTVWDGTHRIEDFDHIIIDGVIDTSTSIQTFWHYQNDYKFCVLMEYRQSANSWKIYSIDTLLCSAPIASFVGAEVFGADVTISHHRYSFDVSSGQMSSYLYRTRIEAETHDSIFAMSEIFTYLIGMKKIYSTKIFLTRLSNGGQIESTSFQDSTGSWVALRRTTFTRYPDSSWDDLAQQFQNGIWINISHLTVIADSEISRYNWDEGINDWLQKDYVDLDIHHNWTYNVNTIWDTTTASFDTTSQQRWENTYDSQGNLTSVVHYNKSGSNPWVKSDSTVYSYALLTVVPVRISQICKKPELSVTHTSCALRVSGQEITGVRLYNSSGKKIAAAKQPAASSIVLDLHKAGTLIPAGAYFAQVITKKGVFARTIMITN
jgi:YD repeat-containing protein